MAQEVLQAQKIDVPIYFEVYVTFFPTSETPLGFSITWEFSRALSL